MEFKKFVNPHRASNTYIVYKSKTAVIIDVGNIDSNIILNYLKEKKLTLKAVFLTHEHADHCCGVDNLASFLDFDLYCALECEQNAQNPKLNYSKYLEDIEDFSLQKKAIPVGQNSIVKIDDIHLKCYQTKGHSPGSMVYQVGSLVFTGDTYMQYKTPLKLPNSSKKEHQQSLQKLQAILTLKTFVCPGHGNVFKSSYFSN
ncbi:MAG: MBL fold metallo-hydrolase [Psychroflexus salarius]